MVFPWRCIFLIAQTCYKKKRFGLLDRKLLFSFSLSLSRWKSNLVVSNFHVTISFYLCVLPSPQCCLWCSRLVGVSIHHLRHSLLWCSRSGAPQILHDRRAHRVVLHIIIILLSPSLFGGIVCASSLIFSLVFFVFHLFGLSLVVTYVWFSAFCFVCFGRYSCRVCSMNHLLSVWKFSLCSVLHVCIRLFILSSIKRYFFLWNHPCSQTSSKCYDRTSQALFLASWSVDCTLSVPRSAWRACPPSFLSSFFSSPSSLLSFIAFIEVLCSLSLAPFGTTSCRRQIIVRFSCRRHCLCWCHLFVLMICFFVFFPVLKSNSSSHSSSQSARNLKL